MADFETTTTVDDCRVWGWGLVHVPDNWKNLELNAVEVGKDLETFLDTISEITTVTYFHNIKFDGKFIIDWLLKNGYIHNTRGTLGPGSFSTLISDMGTFYSITVAWYNGNKTEFRDSYKKLPMSVADVAKAFDMTIGKGEIDYEMDRPVGYTLTDVECDYIRRDVWIVARAIGQQIANGLTKLTVGSDALSEYRKLVGKKHYDYLFPVLSVSLDSEIRRAYRGGFTYADPRFRGKPQGPGNVYDVNSLYPSVMYYKALPYGEPEFMDGFVECTEKRPLAIFSVTFTATLKPDHIPCVQIKGTHQFSPTEYLTRITEPTTLMMTNIDYALMCDHYDVTVLEYGGGWRFAAAHGMFDTYIDKWTRVKMHSTGGMRALAKLQLNSLYGKFATNPTLGSRFPVLTPEGVVRFTRGTDETRNPVYTPVGVFITSYAREVTVRAAQANYARFAYADTDSLHLLDSYDTYGFATPSPASIRVHDSELGAWKHELAFTDAHYIRAKAYLERTADGAFHNAVAGVPVHISKHLRFDDLHHGAILHVDHDHAWREQADHRNVIIHGKLTPRSVAGGVVLQNTPYELVL